MALADSRYSQGEGRAEDRSVLWGAIVLALGACLPYFFAATPQLTDYPSHIARYHVMLESGYNPVIDGLYNFQWMFAGNLGADLLMVPLGHLLGVERAAWLIGFVIPPLTGLAIVAVEWTLRRRIGVATFLALITIWSPAMLLGFYNFCLALALALFAFALWVRLEQWQWRHVVFIPISVVVWLCHMAGWGVLGVLVFGYEWSRTKSWRAFLAPWPLCLPFLFVLTSGANSGLQYGPVPLVYKQSMWFSALRDQSRVLDLVTLALLLGAMALALFNRRIDGRLGWAALITLVLTLVVPRHLGGGDLADYRLIAVALLIGSLAINWRQPRFVLVLVAALFVGRLAMTSAAWYESSQKMEAALEGLDHLPRGAKVAGAMLADPYSWPNSPFGHLPGYAVVRRDALVNSNFAIPGVHMLTLKDGGFVDPSQRLSWRPGEKIDLNTFAPAQEADYLWYFGAWLPDRLPDGAQILHQTPHSVLLRLAKSAQRR